MDRSAAATRGRASPNRRRRRNARGAPTTPAATTRTPARSPTLCIDGDRCAIGHQAPYLVHLLVGDGDAALRPIVVAALAVFEAVNHDVAAGGNSSSLGTLDVVRVGIGNMQRQIVAALWIAAVDDVATLGCTSVAFLLLVPDGVAAEGDAILAKDHIAAQQQHLAAGFVDYDLIGSEDSAAHVT